ncbi:hypothetical protein [Zhihengliuella flava]|uniref:Uncharacterized protein n=1 Tax=Zhihengliuella flava TaxID=1285193 RepID=A0A931D9F3_9MICC|nr:hypothetical protein [Zhihengliuella flava]MBG6083276.1 hypothetical protein [Zhihengliuella flava]
MTQRPHEPRTAPAPVQWAARGLAVIVLLYSPMFLADGLANALAGHP